MSPERGGGAEIPDVQDFARVFAELGSPPLIWNTIHNHGLVTQGTVHGGQHLDARHGGQGDALATAVMIERREGAISAEQIRLAMTGFAQPTWFDTALGLLGGRLLFLAGEPGSGRRTAALNLLRRHTTTFDLRAVDSDVDLAAWRAGTTTARGYLVDRLLETRLLELDIMALDHVRAELNRIDACMVVVVDGRSPRVFQHVDEVLNAAPVRAVPPPPRTVLDAQLDSVLLGSERRQRVLAALPPGLLTEILPPGLGPAQVVEVAAEIARFADGELDATEIREHLSFRAAERAPQLLSSLSDNADDLALLLATSVFEHFDHTLVEEEAVRLLEIARGRLDKPPTGGSPDAGTDATAARPPFVFQRSRQERFAAVGARRAPEQVRAASTYSYLVRPVAFTRHLQGRAVLEHVWREHREAGELLVDWLKETPEGQRRGDRAGFILGQLARWSSGHRALGPVGDLADSTKAGDWRMAARALGSAAADPVLISMIKSRLRDWSRGTSASRRCVVALTCATEFGLARPETALTLLRECASGQDPSGAVQSAVRRALSALFTEPGNRTLVRDALLDWSGGTGPARVTACAAPVHLLRTAAVSVEAGEWWSSHLLGIHPGPGPSDEPHPTLTLIRRALNEPDTYEPMRTALLQWQQRSLTSPHRARAVERLTDALAHHLRGGVFRLFTDLERAYPAPGSHRAAQALADWRKAP